MWSTMGIGRGRRRNLVLGTLLAAILLAVRPCVFALDPLLDVDQYAHTAWKIREGFTKGVIYALAQTPDGYLWLGTEFGLLRFDGVRTVPWQPPAGLHLPSTAIWSLLAARDGTLWIGTSKGLASWKDGKITQYPQLAGQYVGRLVEDHEGTIWVGALGTPNGGLCAIQNGSVYCDGTDGSLGHGVLGLFEDSSGNLWVGVASGLWRWKPGAAKFYPLPGQLNGIRALAEDSDGSLLVGMSDGIRRLVGEKTELAYPISGNGQLFEAQNLLRDRDGGLWIATARHGLVHLHHGKTDLFTRADGLSGFRGTAVFEDREGNIWVSTLDGLDRFRDFSVATLTAKQGLSDDVVGSVLADKDGSVWLGTYGGLNRWDQGQISPYGRVTGKGVPDGKLNGNNPNSLFQDAQGRVFVSTHVGVGYLENNRFTPVNGATGSYVHGFADDAAGGLWIADQELGLLHTQHEAVTQQIPWGALGNKGGALALAADPIRGGLWLGFFNGGIAYFNDGTIRASYSAADGLGDGRVTNLRLDPDGTLWAATEGGLSRLKNSRIVTLTSKNGLPCDTVHWLMEDDNHSFWLYTSCGLVRVARSELEGWASVVEKDRDAKPRVQFAVFDSSDGVSIRAIPGFYVPQVTKSSDGRLWFSTPVGVSVIDPRHLAFNKFPPPVHIEEIIADHKRYDATPDSDGRVGLPPHVRDLQIDYTALSFAAPEKVLFRYKLEGWDRDWHEAGTRRLALYSNLPPRKYTFRVKACNNSGVWNEAGTALDFAIAPAYYQTWWFRLLCVVAFAGLLIAAYRLRLRRVEQQFNLRLEGRVAERTRIARELHDTLLQSFQGALLKLHAVTYIILDRPAEAHKQLETVIDQARHAVTEGRDAVQGLRASTLSGNDLALSINLLCDELTAHHGTGNCPEVQVQVEGASRELAPILRDEIYRISSEAVRNAFLHARATRIEVEVCYEPRQFRLRVRDNGKGIDPKVLESGAREGHYGFPGMRERAKLVGGKLIVWSELNSGTEIELVIPAAVAYAKSPVARRSFFWRRSA